MSTTSFLAIVTVVYYLLQLGIYNHFNHIHRYCITSADAAFFCPNNVALFDWMFDYQILITSLRVVMCVLTKDNHWLPLVNTL